MVQNNNNQNKLNIAKQNLRMLKKYFIIKIMMINGAGNSIYVKIRVKNKLYGQKSIEKDNRDINMINII